MGLIVFVCPNCRSVNAPLSDATSPAEFQCPVCRKNVRAERHELSAVG
ncbi:MAG: hypothetical protein ABSF83_15225 [Nitrososphaerales archaeon]|jgi:predicted RNA-binding Zn-ribbon protein involved in translation (DUF1610 family)